MRTIPVVTFVDADAVAVPGPESRGRLAGVLEALARERIMIVFCSKRTRAQVESTRQALGVFHPFICEDGGAAFVPDRYFGSELENTRKVGGYEALEFAAPYEEVVATLRRVSDRLDLGVIGFNDMSVEQVARECGLSLLDARLAKLREYGEPFRLLRANAVGERHLFRALDAAGLACHPGLAFHHASTAKGPQAAIAVLTTLYRIAFGAVMTAAEGCAGSDPAPQVDMVLEPLRTNPGNPLAAPDWLAGLVHEIGNLRDARLQTRAARFAR
jgi:mannosyl-3-phosphoglycerate phosphatase